MASSGLTSYACKCLNVRIQPAPPPAAPSDETADAEFLQVYVGEAGLSVGPLTTAAQAHPQLTLRSKGPRLDRTLETPRQCIRHVALTCLVCQTAAYRVAQTVSPDVEGGEGPVLPTDDWVENEVLKSATGWVEVSKSCLSGHQVLETESSPLYSSTFRIVLPSGVSSAPSAAPLYVVPSPSPPSSLDETPRTILPPLPALFPPPPFTPAHPVFTHLSAAATSESERLRQVAEDELRAVVAQKVAEIQASEEKLKHEVELIWTAFKGVIDKYEEQINPPRRIPLGRRRSSSKSGPQPGQTGISSSVRVVDFVPRPVAASRTLSPSTVAHPGVSALSVSLATSTIHQAMAEAHARSEQPADADPSRRSLRSASPARSPSTASSRTLGLPINGEAEIRDAYRRNMNESLDVATSFKYMMDLEEQMQARGIPTQPDIPEEPEAPPLPPSPSTSTAVRGRSPRAGKSAIKKPAKSRDTTPHKVAGSPAHAEGVTGKEETTPKGKRKVTFDVRPDVAIISNDEPLSAETTPLPPREEGTLAIFYLT
ncbi:hypothetical protein EIP86_010147 [Pleurotus ostreatoroseus]|nr:hypothetical protein EIP86_010147 [Pleurotus ostreatoroseus]